MRNILQHFVNRLGVRYKFIIPFLIIIAAVCIMFVINIYDTTRRSEEQALYTAQQLVSQTTSFLESKTSNIQNRMEVLAYNENLMDIFNRRSSQYVDNVGLWSLDNRNVMVLTYIVTNDSDVHSLSYYLEDSLSGFAQNEDYHRLDELSGTDWYRSMLENNDGWRWLPSCESSLQVPQDTITLLYTIPSQTSIHNRAGLFRLDMRLQPIRELLNQSVYTADTSVFVLNSNQSLICTSNNADTAIVDACTQLKVDNPYVDSQWIKQTINNSVYLLGTKPVPGTDWIVYMTIPYQDIIAISTHSVRQLILMLIATLLIAVPLAILISSSITKRITYMSSVMKQVSSDQFEVEMHPMGEDELGQLSKTFNYMIGKISTLISCQNKQNREINALELKALQAQINPHFLYNTLDLINWMAIEYHADNITEAVHNLSRFYKLSLSKGEDLVTIGEELAHITSYINIQNMRFSGRISLVVSVPEEYLEVFCPKIILQPIVENAILHGIMESDVGCGTITISLEDCDDGLHLMVEDDGVGMTQEEQKSLFWDPAMPTYQKGYGLRNIDRRLKLYYGEDCGITTASEIGKGTCVTLLLKKTVKSLQKP